MIAHHARGSGSMSARVRGSGALLVITLIACFPARESKAQSGAAPRWVDIPPPNPAAPVTEPPQAVATGAQANGAADVPPRRWYGYQTLSADGAALALLVVGLSAAGEGDSAASVPLTLSAGVYLLGGPVIHAAHSNWQSMGLSVASRVVLPLLGSALGGTGDRCSSSNDSDLCGAGAGLGLVLGIGGAIALDGALFAREPRAESDAHTEPDAPAPSAPPSSTARPFARVDKNRALFGVTGTF